MRGIFNVVAVIGDKIVYASSKPIAGELDAIEKRAFASALKNEPDADPAEIEIFVQPFLPITVAKNPPRPRPVVAEVVTQPAEVQRGQNAQYIATHPKDPIRPQLFKPK